jgi:hypothetical protein
MFVESDFGIVDPRIYENSSMLRLVPLPLPDPVTQKQIQAHEIADQLQKFKREFDIRLFLDQEKCMLDTEELKFLCVRPYDMRLQAIYSVLMGATEEEAVAVAVGRHSLLSVYKGMVTTDNLTSAVDILRVEKMISSLALKDGRDNQIKSQNIDIDGSIVTISNCIVSSQVMGLSRTTLKEITIKKQTSLHPTFTAENLLLSFPSICVLVCSNLESTGRHIAIGRNHYIDDIEKALKMDRSIALAIRVAIYYHTFVCFSRASKRQVYISCFKDQSFRAEMKKIVLPSIMMKLPVVPYNAWWFGLIVRMAVASIGILNVTLESENEHLVRLRQAERVLDDIIADADVNISFLRTFQPTAAYYIGIIDASLPEQKILDLEAFQVCRDRYLNEYNLGRSLVSE